jgi:hypothetical protein
VRSKPASGLLDLMPALGVPAAGWMARGYPVAQVGRQGQRRVVVNVDEAAAMRRAWRVARALSLVYVPQAASCLRKASSAGAATSAGLPCHVHSKVIMPS